MPLIGSRIFRWYPHSEASNGVLSPNISQSFRTQRPTRGRRSDLRVRSFQSSTVLWSRFRLNMSVLFVQQKHRHCSFYLSLHPGLHLVLFPSRFPFIWLSSPHLTLPSSRFAVHFACHSFLANTFCLAEYETNSHPIVPVIRRLDIGLYASDYDKDSM